MYETFFHLARRPFLAAPNVAAYFPSGSHERARSALARAMERAEGPGLLIGAAGTGKTLLLQVLAHQFRPQFKVALLASARLGTRKALLQNILFELGLPYRDREEGELRLSLIDHLAPSPNCQNGLLLLVDEAHTLPLRLLEEIRMITNLVRDGQPRVRLVLAGGASLEERFASPRLESLNQRVAARCYLESLTREETREFIRAQILQAGGDAQALFSDEALRAVHTATDGIPRLVNQLCDHALLMASLGRVAKLEPTHIEEAWADLQQLPAPFTERSALPTRENVVEFGALPEEPTASAPSTPDVSDRLQEIEQQVASASYDWPAEEHLAVSATAASEFRPQAKAGTEVELFFHGPHNPFTEKFQEEETVLDPYALLDSMGARPRVSSAEGREMAALMRPPASERPRLSVVGQSAVREDAGIDVVEPPLDSDTPDVVQSPLAVMLAEPPLDDRDLLVIEEEPPVAPPVNSGRARPQEYKQLFAKLRRG